VAGNPFAGEVVVQTAAAYYLGDWHWLRAERLRLAGTPLRRPRGSDAVYSAAASTAAARRFLVWSRFPFVDVEAAPDGGHVVHFRDARYHATGRLGGPSIRLDRALRPLGPAER
jgi:hypothetical protein